MMSRRCFEDEQYRWIRKFKRCFMYEELEREKKNFGLESIRFRVLFGYMCVCVSFFLSFFFPQSFHRGMERERTIFCFFFFFFFCLCVLMDVEVVVLLFCGLWGDIMYGFSYGYMNKGTHVHLSCNGFEEFDPLSILQRVSAALGLDEFKQSSFTNLSSVHKLSPEVSAFPLVLSLFFSSCVSRLETV